MHPVIEHLFQSLGTRDQNWILKLKIRDMEKKKKGPCIYL